ncbi:conserved hypothetical protein [Burkholderia pseudomallei MSHR346]|nr:conserved hypothetical protein [Burkholderia pseudomallei MSHR346]
MTRGGAPHGRRIRVTPRRAGPAGRHRRIPSNTAGHRQIPPHRPVHRRRSRRAPAPSRAPPTIRRVLAPRTGPALRAPNSAPHPAAWTQTRNPRRRHRHGQHVARLVRDAHRLSHALARDRESPLAAAPRRANGSPASAPPAPADSPIPCAAPPSLPRRTDVVSIHSRLQNIENIDSFDFA